jgi:hypothetical protein
MKQTSNKIITHQRHVVAIKCVRLRSNIRVRPAVSIHSQRRRPDTMDLPDEIEHVSSSIRGEKGICPKIIGVLQQSVDEENALFLEARDATGTSQFDGVGGGHFDGDYYKSQKKKRELSRR